MKLELSQPELRYLNRLINLRSDELLVKSERIRRIRSLDDLEQNDRLLAAETELRLLRAVHDRILDMLVNEG